MLRFLLVIWTICCPQNAQYEHRRSGARLIFSEGAKLMVICWSSKLNVNGECVLQFPYLSNALDKMNNNTYDL